MRSIILTSSVCLLIGCNSATKPNSAASNELTAANAQPTIGASPSASPSSNASPEPSPQFSPHPTVQNGIREAADVVRQYYAAINSHDYRRAYELWSGKGEASKQTFDNFRNGFAKTASTSADVDIDKGQMEGAAGSQYVTIPVRIISKTKDGKEQNFSGEYVLRRSMVDGATPEQRSWRIYSANIRETEE